ncbi:hypothetical protein ACQ4PT_015237 [Festuca glaucescens]
MAAASFLFVLILATASSVHCASQVSNGSCFSAERAALLSFKAGITGDPANRLASWRQGDYDCCRWSGVTCSSRTGHVVKLDLRNQSPTFYESFGVKDPTSHSMRGQVSLSLLALRRLRYLDLSMNTILGDAMAMPGFLGSLKSLKYLNLSSMGFNDIIPPQLGNLSKLVHLDIGNEHSYNYQDSKDISWLARLQSLEHLNMAFVNLSRVDDWFHTVNALPNLVVLVLSNCGLNMSNAPSSLLHHNLTVLEELDLSGNPLNSLAAPNWFWDVISLKSLNLALCELSGTFPDEFGNLTLLENFDISFNNIGGMMPGTLQNMCNLISLDLSGNNISGDIREVIDSIPSCSWKNLQELILAYANISGTTLHFVSNLSSLSILEVVRILDLSNNKFSGAIPQYLKNLRGLTGNALDSDENPFENPFEEVYYGGDGISYTGFYSDSFSEVIKGQVLEYRKNTPYLMTLDLSCNSLTGKIPNEISSLAGLINLNLSSNLLSGNIPHKIGNLRSLESLDLSKNTLGGGIPQSLTNLTYLSYLNLSYNNLSGRIPSGRQLDILKADDPASMYIGNPGLCGDPVPRQCPGSPRDPPTSEDLARLSEDVLFQMDFLLGSIVGFVVGTWVVFCGLLIKKRWRYAYFGQLDQLYDRLYVISVVTWRKWFMNTDGN